MLLEHILEENHNCVAEHDRVGDLHHGGLQVQREQHALLLGVVDLLGIKGAQRLDVHGRGVDDLAGLQRQLVLEHRGLAIAADELDACSGRLRHGHRGLAAVEIARLHERDRGLRVRGPGAHAVGMLLGEVLHRQGGAAIGIAFAQHWVHGAAEHLAIARLDGRFGIVLRIFGIVGNVVTLALQFLDGGLELRQGRRDVRQLDDVGFGLLGQIAKPGQLVGNLLLGRQLVGEGSDDAPSQ